MNKNLLIILVAISGLAVAATLLRAAEEHTDELGSYKSYAELQEKLDDDSLKKDIYERVAKAPRLHAYKAFRAGNTDLCNASSSRKDCWDIVKSFVFQKRIALGQCNQLPAEFSDYTDYCRAVSNKNCNQLSGYKKGMCEAMLARDTKLMVKTAADPDFEVFLEDKLTWAETSLNLYYGFKTNAEDVCNKFTTNNLLRRGACNMLFGNRTLEYRVNEIAQDIFYAAKAKKKHDKDLCSKIRNKAITDVCRDDNVSDHNEIFKEVWL